MECSFQKSNNLYSSIQIVCALKRVFPDIVVQKIRNYAKMAIDLEGYTLNELRRIVKMKKINIPYSKVSIFTKTRKEYRFYIDTLNRSRIIEHVQKFNIDIPILHNRLDNYYRQCNKFNKYYMKRDNELVLCDKITNKETRLSLLDPIRFVYEDSITCDYFRKIGEKKYTIKILQWTNTEAELLIFVRTTEFSTAINLIVSHIKVFAIISKYIQGNSIPDEIINIRKMTTKHREMVNYRSELNTKVNDEIANLCAEEIYYFSVMSIIDKLRYAVNILESWDGDELRNRIIPPITGLYFLLNNFENLFVQEYVREINFDHYEIGAMNWLKLIVSEYNKLAAEKQEQISL